jgi:uncharacterized phage protein (TIGR02218 family)
VNWADTGQRVLMRRGAIGQIRRGRLAFVAEVRSLAHVLGQTVGRTFQATCDAALSDARCGVDLEGPAYKGAGAIIDLLRDRAFAASGLGAFEAGWFTFGTIEWISGPNAQRRVEVLGHDGTDCVATLTLLEAPVRASAEGDTSNYDNYVGIGSWTKIGLNNTEYNDQDAFDAANNRFVAPAP